jgi:SAM-dependent methyltransferase
MSSCDVDQVWASGRLGVKLGVWESDCPVSCAGHQVATWITWSALSTDYGSTEGRVRGQGASSAVARGSPPWAPTMRDSGRMDAPLRVPVLRSIDDVYGEAAAEEEAFDKALDSSLAPRAPEMLFDLAANLGLDSGAVVLDLGCREGWHAIELSRRHGVSVVGIDAVQRHIDNGCRAIAKLAEQEPDVAGRVRLEHAFAERIPLDDASIDLIWCRDVLVHIEDLDLAMTECHRVLRPGARMLIFQMFATEWLDPREASRLWPPAGVQARNTDPEHVEGVFDTTGFSIDGMEEITSEWREWSEEAGEARSSRQLLHAARLIRAPERYIARYGDGLYGVMLSDCLWGVYQMIGKLSPRVYILRKPAA